MKIELIDPTDGGVLEVDVPEPRRDMPLHPENTLCPVEPEEVAHKLLALLMHKQGIITTQFDSDDIAAIDGKNVIIHFHKETIDLHLMDDAAAGAYVGALRGEAAKH